MPQISVINESSTVSDADIALIVPALEAQWNNDLVAAWRVEQATFQLLPAGVDPPPQTSWLVFLDDTDQANKLAYHDLSNDGHPVAKVFAKSLTDQNQSLSVAASHEICEMAVDPNLSTSYQDASGSWWAAEICDPVESDRYGYSIDGVSVSNFVTPRWFGLLGAAPAFDKQGLVHRAFEILAGGYGQQWDTAAGDWNQVNGFTLSPLKLLVPSPGSRRDRRHRRRSLWFRSQVDRARAAAIAVPMPAPARAKRGATGQGVARRAGGKA